MSASLGVSGPNEPEILIRHRGAEREGGKRAGRRGYRGSCWAESGRRVSGIYTSHTYGTHGVGETRMVVDPGGASFCSHHNHYQSRKRGRGQRERERERESLFTAINLSEFIFYY